MAASVPALVPFYAVATIYMWLSKFEYKLIKRNGIKNSVSESH